MRGTRTPTSILRLVPHLIPLPSDRSSPLASSSTQLQRAPVESNQHNIIQEQRSTSINNIGQHVYWPHTNIYHKTCKNVEEKLNSFINIKNKKRGLQPIVLTQHHPLCRKPFFTSWKSYITQHYDVIARNQQHFLTRYKITASGSMGWGIHI